MADWNVSQSQNSGLKVETEYAILVGVVHGQVRKETVDEHLDELEFLALTAGAETVERFTQRLPHPDTRTFVGKGKLQEIADYLEKHEEINLVIFDDDLSGKQTGILEEELKVKIVDRTSLILDIFASRAQSAQARTQVELAQMQYLLPRLRGLWTHLERQRGGIGMRGPGEKEIETDRRIVRDVISKLQSKLSKIDQQNETRRKNRGDTIRVALVGYTNVGKSTLMNMLSKSDVFAENKLFATLDTTVRKVVVEATPFLLSDTVGFIRKLPTHLVESFKSTLDEVRESDFLLHVVDLSHPQYEEQIDNVNQILADLGVSDKPQLMVFNKVDMFRDRNFDDYLDKATRKEIEKDLKERLVLRYDSDNVMISAKTGEHIEELRDVLIKNVREMWSERFPHRTPMWIGYLQQEEE
ncbi:MAG: GTPase HflX [Saprospiraceae bacterium]